MAAAQQPGRAQAADTGGFVSRLEALRFRRTLMQLAPMGPQPVTRAPWDVLPGQGYGEKLIASFDSAVARGRADLRLTTAQAHLDRLIYGRGFASDTGTGRLFGLSANAATVSFDGFWEAQISTQRQRNLSCTPVLVQTPGSGCSGGFTAPRIDNNVQLLAAGVFAQRFHLNVDFDSKRDYAANNIVSAWYQGLIDEKLQRVNVGTVVFQPPPSRFLSASIPTNNFGISAEAVFGPLTLDGIAATQKGSVVATKTFTVGSKTVSPQDKLVRDLDYEADRFFWVVDPRSLPGFPSVDILNAAGISVPADVQPDEVHIYRYVAANQSSGANANYDGITARGVNGSETAGPVRWRLLKPNDDYWIDPSQLWFVLKAKLDPSDYLAVSYRTKSGTLVGTLPTVDDTTKHDEVRLIFLPNRGPSSPVFPYEMRQVYYVNGSSLVTSSLRTSVMVANSERPDSGQGTFLSTLGLAIPTDPATFDIDNRLFPRLRDPGASEVIPESFIVFPSARPFGDPQLSARQRNDSLYVTPEYLLYSQGPPSVFQIRMQYDAAGGGDNRTITLDALQITDGSEKITVNGQRLTRDADYSIDYATGRVTFLDPASLFGNGTATVTASYEQQGLFVQAPTSIAGLTGTLHLGARNTLSFTGLYQAEQTGYTRPMIGYEPRASLLAGATGDFTFDTPALTRFMNHLVSKPSTAPSQVHFNGEVAVSRPDPNRSGDAYLEQFENDASIPLPGAQTAWSYSSVPKSTAGLQDILGQAFDSADAVQLIWQNLVPNGRDSVTQLSPTSIDPTVALTESSTPTYAAVLWMTLHADTAGGIVDSLARSHWTQPRRDFHPRWRTIVTPLSPTGLDLSHNDYFEFALYQADDRPIEASGMRIVVDLGKVSEDELAMAPDSFHVLKADSGIFSKGDTIYTGRQYTGTGVLNTEKTTFGTWSATEDDNGILGDRPDSLINGDDGGVVHNLAVCQEVLAAVVRLYPWGDLGSRCTNHNGFADTEDLDGDNILDAQGNGDDVFRYVIDLSTDSAKYFVRQHTVTDATGRSATWTIYRVPLHGTAGVPIDTIGNPDIHLVKQLRLGFVTPADNGTPDPVVRFGLALMKLTGAAWVARAPRPIESLSGATAQPTGEVVIGTVSTQDSSAVGYTSPPGIGNSTGTVNVTSTQLSQQINEKSLRVQANNLASGERAEGFTRLVAGTENLLAYRQLRVWVRGGPGWDESRLQAYVKLGSDAYNFYLYRAPAHVTTWDPEMVIDMQTWQDLRAQIENRRLQNLPPDPEAARQCGGGDSTAYVACSADGHYFVQVRDPQINPPNLAAIQELSAGMYYAATGTPIAHAELWVDDIRVSQPVAVTGYAGTFNGHVTMSDVATFDVAGVYQDGQFRLMNQNPSYQNVASLISASTIHLDRFLPTSMGLLIPVSVSGAWGWTNPQLVSGTDVQAGGLDGLRRPRNNSTTWSVQVHDPVRPNEARLTRLVLNPLALAASGGGGTTVSSLSDGTSSAWTTTLSYALATQRHPFRLHLGGLTHGLPRWLRESAAGRGITNATLAPWPTALQLTSTLSHSVADLTNYLVPIHQLADTILKPVTSEQFLWRNAAGLTWQPLTMLVFTSTWASTRDLRHYDDTTSLGRVVNASHRSILGADVGVERDRNLLNNLSLSPRLSSWLSPQFSIGTSFVLSRSLTSRNPVRIEGDTAGAYILPQTLDNSRFIEYRVTIDPHQLMVRLLGDSSRTARFLVQVRPIELTRRHTLSSTFDLATFDPGLGYQLALGNFNSFLFRNGQQAIGAANGTSTSAAVAMDLPGGFTAQANYTSTTSDRYQQSTGTGFLKTTGTTTSWPSGRVGWSRAFGSGPIASVQGSAQVQQDRATSFSPFTDGTANSATSQTRRLSPTANVTLRNGVDLRVVGESDRTDANASGNLTQTSSDNWTEAIVWSMRMPRFISGTRRTVQVNLTATQNSSSSCIQRTSDSSCTPYYDLKQLNISSGFTALLARGMQAGLQFGYVLNDLRSRGQRLSTISASVSFRVPLTSLGI
ncbi:MAG: hypothetical protein ACREL5_03460 [Gemmatimonadales bacterium]